MYYSEFQADFKINFIRKFYQFRNEIHFRNESLHKARMVATRWQRHFIGVRYVLGCGANRMNFFLTGDSQFVFC